MEKKFLPTEGFLRSEINPGAIVNTDNVALQAYKKQREIVRRKEQEINTIRNEVNELKGMIAQLLEKIK